MINCNCPPAAITMNATDEFALDFVLPRGSCHLREFCSRLVLALRPRQRQCRSETMSTVVPQLAANMNAAFKNVWKIIGATNPGDFDLVVTRIVELAKDGVHDPEELSRRTLSSLKSAK